MVDENEGDEKYPTTNNSYLSNAYATKAGRYATVTVMKLMTPVRNTNNIVKGIKGRTSAFTGSETNETTPEKRMMNGSVKI